MTLQAQTIPSSRDEGIAHYPDADDLLDLTGYRCGTRLSLFSTWTPGTPGTAERSRYSSTG
jgi:hypothetical protein